LLTRRSGQPGGGRETDSFIHWWEDHVRLFKATIDNNPTYGNKEGGLSTIYEKSLGAVAKGGQSPLAAVYGVRRRDQPRRFLFMDTPGFDPVEHDGLDHRRLQHRRLHHRALAASMAASPPRASKSPPTRLSSRT